MTRSIIAALVLVTMVPASSWAQVASGPLAASAARLAKDVATHQPPLAVSRAQNGTRISTATKISVGFAGAVVGLLVGARIGAAVQGNCGCDDPGLQGAIVGAPIGAIAGAIGFIALVNHFQ